MPRLKLHLFGGVRVEDSGRPLGPSASQPKRLALLAFIARAGMAGVGRDRILALLWPESDEAKARNSLNQALHAVRRDLGADTLLDSGITLRLNTQQVNVDVAQFEARIEARELEQAVELYVAPFLDGFHVKGAPEFERWVDQQRAELHKQAVDAARTLADAAFAERQFDRAERWARRTLSIDPLNEAALRRLLETLRDAGDTSRAIRLYQDFAERLRNELEIEPSAESQALYKQLRVNGSNGTYVPVPHPSALPTGAADVNREPAILRNGRPGRRASAIGASLLAAVAVIGAFGVRGWLPVLDPRHVHIIVPHTPGDSAVREHLRLVQDWVLLAVSNTRRFTVSQEVANPAVITSTAKLAAIARTHGAGTAIVLEASPSRDSLLFRITHIDASRKTVEKVAVVSSARDQAELAAERIRQTVLASLAPLADTAFARSATATSAPSSWEAFQLFVTGRDLFIRSGSNDALALLDSAAATDSSFTLPLVWKLFGLLAQRNTFAADTLHQKLTSRRAQLPPLEAALFDMAAFDLQDRSEDAFLAAQRVAKMSRSGEWNYWAAREAMFAGYPRAALRLLDEMAPDNPWRLIGNGDPYWTFRYWVRINGRDFEGLLADVPQARSSAGKSAQEDIPVFQARALAALGRTDEVMSLLRGVADGSMASGLSADDIGRLVVPYLNSAGKFEFSRKVLDFVESQAVAPDQARRGFDPNAIDWRAPKAYWRRDWHLARVLYDSAAVLRLHQFIKMNRMDVVVMMQGRRGGLAARLGDTTAALRIDEWLARAPDSLALHRLSRPPFMVARAKIAAMLGRKDRALELLDEAMRRQWDGTIWMETEFESLRGDPMFERITKPRG